MVSLALCVMLQAKLIAADHAAVAYAQAVKQALHC